MSLNIFPRRDTRQQSEAVAEPPLQPETTDTRTTSQDSTNQDSTDQNSADTSTRRRASRSRRGGSGRSSSSTAAATESSSDGASGQDDAEAQEDTSSSSSRSRSRSGSRSSSSGSRSSSRKEADTAGETSGDESSGESTKKSASSRSSSSRSTGRSKSEASGDESGDDEASRSRSSRSRSRKKSDDDGATGDTIDSAAIVKALESQAKQIEELTKTVKDFMKNNGGGGGQVAAPPVRVGIFVDVANVELGADRAKIKLHWGKILNLLSKDRQLVRAMAYAPVHDDPDVSRETQRFVEPFLDNGYKIVTKHLKRFSDGTIKANVDIEMTLDILNMLDRLDVVCLVSGDGDFEPLVQAAQDRGVRVEVVADGQQLLQPAPRCQR
ncbi:MAG: NYN domain-containing protein [Dehalococcoidia bacterium]|nr:NYN domain-containing protein [Dehalococcoidia bacterium]